MARSVLIVEDEPRFREAFARAVRGADDLCLAGVADNLSNGLLLLDSLEPAVLLVDLGLPGGSPISPAIARRLLARVRGRACLQAVSDPSSRVLVAAGAAGADGADDECQRLQLRRDGRLDGRVAPYRCDLCQAHLPEASGRLQDGGGL